MCVCVYTCNMHTFGIRNGLSAYVMLLYMLINYNNNNIYSLNNHT